MRKKRKPIKKKPKPKNVIGFVKKGNNITYFDEDILINQLGRESNKIAITFDKVCQKEMKEMSNLFSHITMYVQATMLEEKKSEAEDACNILLMNTATSYLSALSILRNGFRLQPGIILRNVVESISTILHIFNNPADLKRFKDGDLKSTATLAEAKKVIPLLGQLYGHFSSGFAHLGELYVQPHPVLPYENSDEEPLVINISFLKMSIFLLFVVTELVCYAKVDKPRFWALVDEEGRKIKFAPSDEVLVWMDTFLEFDKWENY